MRKYCIGCRKISEFELIKDDHYRCKECGTEVVITPEYEYWAIAP